MTTVLVKIIEIYQQTISPDHGIFKGKYPYGFCRFYPSCSEYAKQVIKKQGVVAGLLLGIKRVFKCNPFTKPQINQP